jgi:hypothetical protein
MEIIAKAFYQPVYFVAKMNDGTPVKIEYQDKGDLLFAYDANKNRFEAYTSWLRILDVSPAALEKLELYRRCYRDAMNDRVLPKNDQRPWPVGTNPVSIYEEYIQVRRSDVEIFGPKFRRLQEAAALDAQGVDLRSINIEPQGPLTAQKDCYADVADAAILFNKNSETCKE